MAIPCPECGLGFAQVVPLGRHLANVHNWTLDDWRYWSVVYGVGKPARGPKGKPDAEKDPAAVAMGKRGGRKGGVIRARRLTPERRSEIARQGAKARWDKAKGAKT